MRRWIITFLTLFCLCFFVSVFGEVKRPPQFIVFSFDNCTELARWQELSDFLQKMHRAGIPIHFTFFVSGTNFLTDANKALYQGPGHKAGEAEIPFGGSAANVAARMRFINKLYHSGNEFGSHGVGHFKGANWSTADWIQEFNSYANLFNNIAKNNDLAKTVRWDFPLSKIVGFRAPYLSEDAALYSVLKSNHFRYDASGNGNNILNANIWPKKNGGLWYFDLMQLQVAGLPQMPLSMDYNFMVVQSKAYPQANKNIYGAQMLETYTKYFLENYTGNRAPLRFGNHFTDFEGGVYNQALLLFARRVCGLPEVRCVSFVELADFLDKQDAATLKAYQRGDFPHAPKPMMNLTNPFISKK